MSGTILPFKQKNAVSADNQPICGSTSLVPVDEDIPHLADNALINLEALESSLLAIKHGHSSTLRHGHIIMASRQLDAIKINLKSIATLDKPLRRDTSSLWQRLRKRWNNWLDAV